MWWIYALLSAFFASLTAIFAKVDIANVNTNLATAIRSIVILAIAWGLVFVRGEVFNFYRPATYSFWLFQALRPAFRGYSILKLCRLAKYRR